MRTKCFLFLFASLICLRTAQAQEWSREIAVELPGQSMTTTPYFDIDPITNHLHIVSMMNPGVLYTEMDGEGTILKQQTIAAAAKDQGGVRFGATIAVDPNGRPHICYREDAGTNKYTSYYTYYDGSKWTTPVIISNRTYRGYVLPIDIASNGKAHIARGSATGVDPDPMIGPVQYYRFNNGNLEKTRDDITQYRCDDRIVINASYQNQVHLVLGCPDYPVTGGPVWYWRSFDGGETWTNSEIHNSQARFANGAPDLFVDASGAVHIVSFPARRAADRVGAGCPT